MIEPILVRCCRCDAIVALQDAAKCQIHQTDVLCHYCWIQHLEAHAADDVQPWEYCWSERPLPLIWE